MIPSLSSAVNRHYIVTDFGTVLISDSTLAAMDAVYPGWREAPIRGRTKAVKRYNAHAKRGAELLERATLAIAELTWVAEQEFLQI